MIDPITLQEITLDDLLEDKRLCEEALKREKDNPQASEFLRVLKVHLDLLEQAIRAASAA
ncbi:MAG: hypothetical protein KGL39_05640 [Patescibacteria group bacterium]|nr:hypothetical protein [Patescibacteria group bacterium]